MKDLTKLCNRDLMYARKVTIDEMNHRTGWKDRTELDLIQAEIKRRIENGRML